jgi:hypothetical protein
MERIESLNSKIRDFLWRLKIFQYKVEIIQDNPLLDSLEDNVIYVVMKNLPRWVYLKCPCGCKEVIMLSLDRNQFPSWTVKQDKFGRATLMPSIRKLDGCKSHFFIKKGKLIWAFNY